MEDLVNRAPPGSDGGGADLFGGTYRGRRVLVTGHTGFKGSWLALWLEQLGAEVYGYALPPPTRPSHWDALGLSMRSEIGDVRELDHLKAFMAEARPEVVFHLAAQPLVRLSYELPLETFTTNVIGTVNVYEACRGCRSVRAVVGITTDKVYEDRGWVWGYRENDVLGGHDPYSASKAAADIASTSYRRCFWPPEDFGKTHNTLMSVARAGNVIGGGDWALDRLIPDLVRGAAAGEETVIRSPHATRPWEHVLEPLSGYLLLGQRLLEGRTDVARAWNFGPASNGVLTVREIVAAFAETWPAVRHRVAPAPRALHETTALTLDCTLARSALEWQPVWDGLPCLHETAEWYRAYYERKEVRSRQQLARYVDGARELQLVWTRRNAPA